MNLQDLRDELTTRAAATDQHHNDLLPGVRHKIRRTKQHRIAATTAAAAVLAAVVAAFLPGTHSATPPADRPPEDYTRDGVTVPGTVGSDKLLKAWIGDRGQDKLSFSWTPTTDSITVHANCDADGGMYAVRFKINGWYVGDAGCLTGPEAWAMGSSVSLRPDSPFWLASPIGRPAQVTADVIDLSTRRVVTPHARISLGIYSTPYDPSAAVDGAPARTVPPAPSDYNKDGVVYRQRIGGDTLAGAQVADPGDTQVHFSFTSSGRPLVLHPFCTANAGSDSEEPPYSVSVRIGPGKPNISTCVGNSTDAGAGDSVTLPAPVPAGQ
ncbi:MAG: hypothetical protein HOV67_07545, partial [Kribbellaceae bacterium]|nr:hypothetical protein [Kribbellaceae bacterium]